MMETIAVLFIFFILVALGIAFYSHYQEIIFKEKEEAMLKARAMDVTAKVLFLPELACSRGEAEIISNCVDELKINVAMEAFRNHLSEYYFDLFSYAKIMVTEVYPEQNTWELYNRPSTGEEKNTELTNFVINLRDETKAEGKEYYSYGYLTVEVYS